MVDPETISEDQIQDFLDGRLDREASLKVIESLRTHPAEAVRIVELMANDAALRRLGAAMIEREIPRRLTAAIDATRADRDDLAYKRRAAPVAPSRRRLRALARPLAASLLFVFGLGLGWYGSDRLVPRLGDSDLAFSDAMTAFSFYVEEPDAPIQYSHAELPAIARQLAHWPIIASGTGGYRTAEVTLGGVDTDGVASSRMES